VVLQLLDLLCEHFAGHRIPATIAHLVSQFGCSLKYLTSVFVTAPSRIRQIELEPSDALIVILSDAQLSANPSPDNAA
jgi:AraC-like DNA-binding protein